MLERVVRNNTRKSSLFKIQAEKNRFQDHMTQFGLCRLFQLFPECVKEKEFLKELTETFVKYSFEASKKSPFFKGMNYNGKEMGFSETANNVYYREWLPNVKEAYLVGNFSEEKHLMEEGEDGFFELTIHEEGQIKIMEGAKVQLIVIDQEGKQSKIAPPSSRIVSYDYATKEFYGIYRENQPQSYETVETNSLLAYEIDLHQINLQETKTIIPLLQDSKFNTVIFKNLFNFKDKTLTPSLLNRFSVKLSYEQVDLLQDFIQRLRSEQIFVLFELDFDISDQKVTAGIEETLCSENGFSFDLKNEFVNAFLLSFISSHLKQFKVDGYKIANIEKLMLRKEKWSLYSNESSNTEHFISDCSRESLLFVKMLIMALRRTNYQTISYSTSNCKVPGLNLPLEDGGFGVTFSSTNYNISNYQNTVSSALISSIVSRVKQNYFNVEVIPFAEQNALLTATAFLSRKGIVHTNQTLFEPQNTLYTKQVQLLKQINYFRSQWQYFSEQSYDIVNREQLLVFERSRFSFVCNFAAQSIPFTVSTETGSVKYCSSNESIISSRNNGILEVIVPQQSVVVVERETEE